MQDVDAKILASLIEKDYVVMCPKGDRDLRRDYPELNDYPEISRLNSPSEVLFVWWYSCQSSPIKHLPDEKRFPMAVDAAFKKSHAEERKKMYAPTGQAPKLPPELKAACRVMEGFNPGLRISMAVDNMHLLRQCQHAIRQDISGATQEEIEDYMKTAALARKLYNEILRDIERGNHGVEEVQNTTLSNLEGVAAQYHKSKAQ